MLFTYQRLHDVINLYLKLLVNVLRGRSEILLIPLGSEVVRLYKVLGVRD